MPAVAPPVVVCDAAEHASAKDHPRREEYVARSLERSAPREVYDRLDVPVTAIDDTRQDVLAAMADAGYVRPILGEGRSGLEWLHRIDLP